MTKFHFILLLCTWLSWMLSIIIVSQCNFMVIDIPTTETQNIFDNNTDDNPNTDDNTDDDRNTNNIEQHQISKPQPTLGLFTRPFYDTNQNNQFLGCIRYSENIDNDDDDTNAMPRDTKFHTGQAFGILTIIFLSTIMIVLTGMIFFVGNQYLHVWNGLHIILACATISQMLTFISLGADKCSMENDILSNGCSLSVGGKLAIWNIIILCGVTFGWFFTSSPTTSIFVVHSSNGHSNIDTDNALNAVVVRQKSLNVPERYMTKYKNQGIIETIDEMESVTSEDCGTNNDPLSVPQESRIEANIHHRPIQDKISFRLSFIILLGLVWMMTILGIHRCTFVLVGYVVENDDDTGNNIQFHDYSGIGLYSLAIHDNHSGSNDILGCVAYPSQVKETFDTPTRISRSFGMIATLLSSIMVILGLAQLFLLKKIIHRRIWSCFRVFLPITICTQLICFTIFGSEICHSDEEVNCQLGGTGKMHIFNILVFLLLWLLVLKIPSPNGPILVQRHLTKLTSTNDVDHHIRSHSKTVSDPPKSYKDEFIERIRDMWMLRHMPSSISSVDDNFIESNNMATPKFHDSNRCIHNSTLQLVISSITIQIEYTETEKKTKKVTTYTDGSQMITTTIDDIDFATTDDEDDLDDDTILLD